MATNVKIDAGSAFNGDAIKQGGIGNYIYLINKEDLDAGTITVDTGATEEITALVLDSGTQGYKFESSKGSAQIIPSAPLRVVSGIDGYDHTIDVRLPDVTQVTKETIKKMRFQKVVAIVPLVTGQFELYGRNVGMRISDFQYMPGDADTGGTLQFILKCPDNDAPEIDPPHTIADSFDITSLDTPAA